ncbi:Permease of the drug/metabolite transporter (DMT) superfamily [Tistlia consotensis]|uniref:Permease of the drug/metabolite transporter (DMT) superfamily n=1 Tax=Tistlia consotensis USBA 355 TaxID=560819 RepID=A0A1Y6C786_9PROT|nr:DMT family transporter [Tistlia consotensis]SMF40613.1 Permease of the drug/metabolite transporter (DMT) superfamily [Tistlia consotensis USBA 355]SNR74689.1 Permease of the drug/metabolite transporter (DMT) superfamily [Tistlia consotensis]
MASSDTCAEGGRRAAAGDGAVRQEARPDEGRESLPALAGHRQGILWMLLAICLFVSMDATAKYLSQDYAVPQIVWARYLFHVLLVCLVLNRRLPRLARSGRLGLQLLRSLLLVATTGCFFLALSLMPLANASAIMLVAPLVVTGLSVPLLGEPVGVRRWCAVVVGFVGALIVLKPGVGVFEWASLLPLLTACIYALYQIVTRLLAQRDSPLTTTLYTGVVGALLSSAVVPWFWQSPDAAGWALMAAVGLIGTASQFCLIKAFQNAPAAVVSPFGYSNMVWAILYGLVLFGDFPGPSTLIGAGVLIGSGLYVWHRERRRTGITS